MWIRQECHGCSYIAVFHTMCPSMLPCTCMCRTRCSLVMLYMCQHVDTDSSNTRSAKHILECIMQHRTSLPILLLMATLWHKTPQQHQTEDQNNKEIGNIQI